METSIIAAYGAVLSTTLLGIKLWEIRKDRFKLASGIGWSIGEEHNNVITIVNQNKNPITILYYELFWAKKLKNDTSHKILDVGNEQGCFIEIPAFSTKELNFSGQRYFRPKSDNSSLYISISVAGRKKAIVLKLYPR